MIFALPVWYFSSIAHPFVGGLLFFVPFIGILALFVGVVMGIIQRKKDLFLFCCPLLVSECYVAIAMEFHGQVSGHRTLVPSYIFLFVHMAIIGYLLYRLGRGNLAVWALTVFSISYALYAWFVGQMAFTDTWL